MFRRRRKARQRFVSQLRSDFIEAARNWHGETWAPVKLTHAQHMRRAEENRRRR